MVRKVWLVIFMVLFMGLNIKAEEILVGQVSLEYTLYLLDEFRHSPEEFSSIINIIRKYHPDYSDEGIVNLITLAYYTIKQSVPKISIYDVAYGIKRFSSDKLCIDLKDLVRAYINSQLPLTI
ncbi:MAG: hypothetical protein NC822_05330 [Candidatus Omnitrophica bacterium]|nr:hypothetical protein [Candidatus Omnitrophota bacterium]MCM8827156.1 hypothetical protein [Candidatus Omnitrophota bacterium]